MTFVILRLSEKTHDWNLCTTSSWWADSARSIFPSAYQKCCCRNVKAPRKSISRTKYKLFPSTVVIVKNGHCWGDIVNFIGYTNFSRRLMPLLPHWTSRRRSVLVTWYERISFRSKPFLLWKIRSFISSNSLLFLSSQNAEFVELRRQRLQIYLLGVLSLLPEVSKCNTRTQLECAFPFLKQSHQI